MNETVNDERYLQVLDHGFIGLKDSMGGDLAVVNAARVSYGKQKDHLSDGDFKLIQFLADNKHMSPFRHTQLILHLKAPEVVMRQWYKHVVGVSYTEGAAMHVIDHAWNELSMRYVDMSGGSFYIPDEWRMQAEDNKQASTDVTITNLRGDFDGLVFADGDNITSHVKQHVDNCLRLYEALVQSGVAKEQARMVLPMNIYTEVIWTASLQAVVNFLELRDHSHAQYEIRLYAKALRDLAERVAPFSVNALLGSK